MGRPEAVSGGTNRTRLTRVGPGGHHLVESGDLAYTVAFERGEVSIDANAPASMTIRVTHIYRRIDGEWYLVNRHADFPPSDQRAPPVV